jgi:phosphoribosylformylglycinamidine cyclo-ligase
VNHCVNDIAVQGATPLFFMDYLAVGKLDAGGGRKDRHQRTGRGLQTQRLRPHRRRNRRDAGLLSDGEYDLAGFIVGAVERDKIITGKAVEVGDVLIGLPSTGLHTNGYSLARKLLFFEVAGYSPDAICQRDQGQGRRRADEAASQLPGRIVAAHRPPTNISAMAHITGGGITENLPRVLPKNVGALRSRWAPGPCCPSSSICGTLGNIPQAEMMRTFNMGIGLIAAIPAAKFTRAKNLLDRAEEKFYVIGRVVKGERRVQYT